MSEKELQMNAALKAAVKAAGGEVRVSAREMAEDRSVVAMFPADDDAEEMMIKRFDDAEDATLAVEQAMARVRGEAI